MNRRSHLSAAALCLLLSFAAQLYGQTPSGKTPAQSTGKQNQNAPSAKRARPDPLAAERRATALMLATSLAEEARSFRDESLRARVLARTADALWESETERARALFRRAWDAADTADRESLRRIEEQRRADSSGPSFRGDASYLRGEVLRLAARRDRALGEEFLARAAEGSSAEPLTITPASGQTPVEIASSDPEKPAAAIAERLGLASQLLEEGDVERALQFADKALDRVTTQGILFLSLLREKNQAAADQRFAALLARSINDPAADAVTVSVLSSYAFTPFLYIVVRRDGENHSSQHRDNIVAPVMSPELRAAFFRTAAQILLRPLPTPDQDRTLAGRGGLYFTIARLLPLFDQYAADYSPELRAQLGALTPDAPEQFRNGRSPLLTRGIAPEETMKDEGQEALENLDRAPNGEERDNLHARAAMVAARKGDARARDYADKIDDSDFRKRARAHVDFVLLNRAIEKKETTEALRLARTGELTNVQRAYALMEIARLMTKADPTRAAEILDEALAEARRISGSDVDRPRALIGVATRLYEINPNRAWEVLNEALKAANAVSDFTGEDAQIVSRFITKRGASTTSFTVDIFDLNRIFSLLARDDLARAVELAKAFNNEAPRSVAALSIVRAVLNQKPGERRGTSDQREIRNE